MSMDEFDAQPSLFGGGGASAAQELKPEEPTTTEGEVELTPPEHFYFDAGVHMTQEEETSTDQLPKPSQVPIPNDAIPSAPTSEL